MILISKELDIATEQNERLTLVNEGLKENSKKMGINLKEIEQ